MSSRQRSRVLGPVQALAMLLAFLLASVTGGVLLAGLAVPVVTAAGSVSNATTGIFTEVPEEFDMEEPSEMSTMYAADGSVMTNFFINERIIVASDQISPYLKDATVAIEDRRFYDHNGVDIEGLARAFVLNIFAGTSQGASTLTQQYIKNVRVEESQVTGDPEIAWEATRQTYGRKLEEARLAISLEKKYTKDEILVGYLNLAQYGKDVWGVEAASQRYFGISAADLSLSQAAVLAAIPQAPGYWDPTVDPEANQERRDKVLNDMLEEGMITQAQHDEAVAIDVADLLDVHKSVRGCASTGNMAYFCEYVVAEILQNPAFGETEDERRDFLYRNGQHIYTTIDPEKQQAAFESVTATVPINDPSNIKAMLTSVEPGTGRIVAMAQNTNFGKPSDEDPTATEVNLNVGRSHGGGDGYHTGSSFKPLILTQWLKDGHTLGDIVMGNRQAFAPSMWTISCNPSEVPTSPYTPKNLEGTAGDRISVINATRVSANIPFVEMASQMDLCAITETAASMGLERGNGDPLVPNPSMVLGTNTVTPLAMANAFATYATNGTYCTPVAIERIVSTDGEEISVPQTECTKVLDDEVAAGVNYALQEVNRTGGTGWRAAISGRATAGKTGTANENMFAWYVGYTPQLAAAVVMGHQGDWTPMIGVTINGQWHRNVNGGSLPAPTWRAYMVRALEGVESRSFPEPSQRRTIYGDLISVPSVVGLSVLDAQTILEDAGFTVRVSEEPVFSDSVREGLVASQNPSGGSQQVSGSVIELAESKGPEPQPEPEPTPEPEEPAPPAEEEDD